MSRYETLPSAPQAHAARADFEAAVRRGLTGRPRVIPPWFWYDAEGSRLFDAVCDTPEYYLTRVEAGILERSAPRLAATIGEGPIDVVDLGCGDGRKTAPVIAALRDGGAAVRYVPIDISGAAVDTAAAAMIARFPGLAIQGLIGEYFDGISWLSKNADRPRLVMFLGSNIGNFPMPEASAFATRLCKSLSPGDRVLIGFDLRKPGAPLIAAYNDSEGVGPRFSLNLLRRINRELGADFDLERFEARSTYDPVEGAIRMYLISLEEQSVYVRALDRRFDFEAFDPIQVGYSYKFRPREITQLAREARVDVEAMYFDDARWFCDAVWRIAPG